jgi:parallel beta-helix repeat protein
MKERLAHMKRLAPLSAVVLAVLSVLATAPAAGAQFDILVHPSLTPCVSTVPPVPIFPAIQDAVNAAVSGDVIGVCPATYAEHVLVTTAGVSLRAAIGLVSLLVDSTGGTAFTVAADDVTIYGFDISGYDIGVRVTRAARAMIRANKVHDNFFVGIVLERGSDSRVIANSVHHNGEGITVSLVLPPGPGHEIGNNVVFDNTELGIRVEGSSGINLHHNTVTGSGWAGILVTETVAGLISWDVTVQHNNVRRNLGPGVFVSHSGLCRVEVNAVVDNGDTGIALAETGDCTVRSNTAAYNGGGGIETVRSIGTMVILNNVYRNTLDGIGVADSQGGEKFICNTSRFNNVIKAPSGFDCDWDESDAPTFVRNACATQTPDLVWSMPGRCVTDP